MPGRTGCWPGREGIRKPSAGAVKPRGWAEEEPNSWRKVVRSWGIRNMVIRNIRNIGSKFIRHIWSMVIRNIGNMVIGSSTEVPNSKGIWRMRKATCLKKQDDVEGVGEGVEEMLMLGGKVRVEEPSHRKMVKRIS